jgi:hypothetical protein
MYLE